VSEFDKAFWFVLLVCLAILLGLGAEVVWSHYRPLPHPLCVCLAEACE
jgi:hypothetical protein